MPWSLGREEKRLSCDRRRSKESTYATEDDSESKNSTRIALRVLTSDGRTLTLKICPP
jgi:hypothetical protein